VVTSADAAYAAVVRQSTSNKETQSVKSKLVIGMVAAAAVTVTAVAATKPQELIRTRQSGYTFMAWNMHRIKAQIDHPATYNKDEVVRAANVIAAIANSGLGELFPPGTEKGKGWHKTEVKAKLFTDKEGVKKVAMEFNKQANELAKIAATGDASAVKTQFGKLGESCKGCHDKFREKEEHD
jgi:cytochrome c556